MSTEFKGTHGYIAVIYGGRGPEHEISKRSGAAITALLRAEGYSVLPIEISRGGEWTISRAFRDIPRLSGRGVFPVCLFGKSGFLSDNEIIEVALAIPALHGKYGEDGVVQGALEAAKISYLGSGVTAGAIALDKAYTKYIAEALGIPTLPFVVCCNAPCGEAPLQGGNMAFCAEAAAELAEERLGEDLFIKPSNLGSSYGIARAKGQAEAALKIKEAQAAGGERVIIEPYLKSRTELECAYLGGDEIFTPPGEIRTSGVYDFDKKYLNRGYVEISSVSNVAKELQEKIKEYSREIVYALGIRDLARIDFFLAEDRLYFNEVNTFPGFTEGSLYPSMLADVGIFGGELARRLVALAAGRRL